jgi:hypothetical protein
VNAATDLEQLALRADAAGEPPAGDGSPPGGQPPPGPEASPNFGAIAFMLSAFRELTCKMLSVESPKKTLSDANIEQCATVLAPVADKYGVNLGMMFNGPEGMALMIAGPLLWEAATQLNLELKARRAKPVDEEREPAPAGG